MSRTRTGERGPGESQYEAEARRQREWNEDWERRRNNNSGDGGSGGGGGGGGGSGGDGSGCLVIIAAFVIWVFYKVCSSDLVVAFFHGPTWQTIVYVVSWVAIILATLIWITCIGMAATDKEFRPSPGLSPFIGVNLLALSWVAMVVCHWHMHSRWSSRSAENGMAALAMLGATVGVIFCTCAYSAIWRKTSKKSAEYDPKGSMVDVAPHIAVIANFFAFVAVTGISLVAGCTIWSIMRWVLPLETLALALAIWIGCWIALIKYGWLEHWSTPSKDNALPHYLLIPFTGMGLAASVWFIVVVWDCHVRHVWSSMPAEIGMASLTAIGSIVLAVGFGFLLAIPTFCAFAPILEDGGGTIRKLALTIPWILSGAIALSFLVLISTLCIWTMQDNLDLRLVITDSSRAATFPFMFLWGFVKEIFTMRFLCLILYSVGPIAVVAGAVTLPLWLLEKRKARREKKLGPAPQPVRAATQWPRIGK